MRWDFCTAMNGNAILLASGASRRFGTQNKLLVPVNGVPLAEHAAMLAKEAFGDRVTMVTAHPELFKQCAGWGVEAIFNPHPEQGISHSIRLGIAAHPTADYLCFLVCDQPYLKPASLLRMKELAESTGKIVAPKAGDVIGNPVFFPRQYFPELLALSGDRGGKRVLLAHLDAVRTVPVESYELLDIDTYEDWERSKS